MVFRNGYPNIWSLHPIALTPRVHDDRPVVLLDDLGDFNLVREGAHYWGLSKTLGPTDPTKLERRDYPPVIYSGATAETVRLKVSSLAAAFQLHIHEDRSVALVEDLGDFNLVREGAHYWGTVQDTWSDRSHKTRSTRLPPCHL